MCGKCSLLVCSCLEQADHGILSPAPGLSDRALQEIALAPPALRFDAHSIVYTDGSKKGTLMSAAWIHPSSGNRANMQLAVSSGPQRTPLRAELIALSSVLHSPLFPLCRALHDSLTGLYLVNGYLVRPHQLC